MAGIQQRRKQASAHFHIQTCIYVVLFIAYKIFIVYAVNVPNNHRDGVLETNIDGMMFLEETANLTFLSVNAFEVSSSCYFRNRTHVQKFKYKCLYLNI